MPIFMRDDRAVLFIHVPKTGGTSVERVFEASGWTVDFRMTMKTNPNRFPLRRVSPQHYHAALLEATLRLAKFESTFMVVRDPLARFRSEYAHRVRDPRLGDPESVERWATGLLKRYARNQFVLDNHLRPQHEFQLPGALVYRLEDSLEQMLADLNRRFGLGVLTETKRHLDSNSPDRLASRDVQLNPAVTERLQEFYAKDYEAFGYPR